MNDEQITYAVSTDLSLRGGRFGARRLSSFNIAAIFRNWLDPQMPPQSRIGIHAVKFQGVSDYLKDLPQKLQFHLGTGEAGYVVGLVDLYGLPPDRFDFTKCNGVSQKVDTARKIITSLVPVEFQDRFRQHFAVHEIEAWLLAYPEEWLSEIRNQIAKRRPEEVNFNEPPAKFLSRLLKRKYKKTVSAKNLFPRIDPQTAINKCPYLKLLSEDLLRIAKLLQ